MPGHSSAPYLAARDSGPADGRAAMLERVTGHWQSLLRGALAPLDLTTAQYRLLVATAWLGSRQVAVRQSEIAAHANADAVMTSEVLRTLERRGLIERAPHPSDRRAKSIVVTEAGGALADRAARLVDNTEARFFETGMVEFGLVAKSLKKGGRGDVKR